MINFKIHADNFYENDALIRYLMMHENDKQHDLHIILSCAGYYNVITWIIRKKYIILL